MPPWDPRAGLVRGWSDMRRELEGPPGARLLRHQPATVPVLPILLGTQHLHHLPRNRLHPHVARDQGALADRPRTGASGLGVSGSGRLRTDAGSALAVRRGRAEGRWVLAILLPGADRERGVLGDPVAQHTGL